MLTSVLKDSLVNIIKIIRITVYNKRHAVKIYSLKASLKAHYGKSVSIGKDTMVAENVQIGDMSYINQNSWVENCKIGKWCSISDHVMICPAEHCIGRVLSHPVFGNKESEQVIIGNDVLISHNVTILQGISIGDGAVIGAGAVVTKNIGEYEIWGGVPAKFIKMRFGKNEIQEIHNCRLYDMQLSEMILFEQNILKNGKN